MDKDESKNIQKNKIQEEEEVEGEGLQLIIPQVSINRSTSSRSLPKWFDRPYHVWRNNFQQDRCCSKKDVKTEFFVASCPFLVANLSLLTYLWGGAFMFQCMDNNQSGLNINQLILFCFTTISTIGYGDIYPTSIIGKLICMLYILLGIPIVFTTISMNSQLFVGVYNIICQSLNPKAKERKNLPFLVSLILLITHCLVGAIIFSCWIDEMSFISALYFSFISISTIGFGDFLPTPDNFFEHVVIIAFLSTGIGILTTFFGSIQKCVLWIHYHGRQISDSKEAEIWFDGNMMTVQQFVTNISGHFECTPEKLRDVLRDLDKILEVACNQSQDEEQQESIKLEEECCLLNVVTVETIKQPSPQTSPMRKKTVFLDRLSTEDDSCQVTINSFTGSNQRTIPKDTENAIHALSAIQHHLRKPSTRGMPGQPKTPPLLHHFTPKSSSDSKLDTRSSPLELRKKALGVHNGRFITQKA